MPLYYRDAEIALLVFDLTDTESFKGVDYWLNELESKVATEGMLLCTCWIKDRYGGKQEGLGGVASGIEGGGGVEGSRQQMFVP